MICHGRLKLILKLQLSNIKLQLLNVKLQHIKGEVTTVQGKFMIDHVYLYRWSLK